MSKDTRHRRWMLTINNPGEDWTHELIRSKLQKMNLSYWCLADEKGLAEQIPHTHIYFISKISAIRFSTVKGHFPTAHIEPAQSTSEECRAYVQKSGKWAQDEKADTSIPGTFEEWGDLPTERPGQRTDLARAYELLEDGANVMDIIRDNPDMMRYRSHLEQTRQDLLSEQYRNTPRLGIQVTYIFGETGTGKTRSVGYEDVYRVTSYTHGLFDMYLGEGTIVFDEFASSLPIQQMLNYLDIHPLTLPCRYANRVGCYTKVYIISNIPLELQYTAVQAEYPSVWHAFTRRIHKVIQYTGIGVYNEYATQKYLEMQKHNSALDGWAEIDDTGDLPFE